MYNNISNYDNIISMNVDDILKKINIDIVKIKKQIERKKKLDSL